MTKKILLVEDEALLAENETQTLEKTGYEVEKAYSGEEAIEIVDSDPEMNLVLISGPWKAGSRSTDLSV